MTLFAASTHPGLKRARNEDCYEASSNLGLWLVADGVGGHANGDVASAIVRETIKSGFSRGESLVDSVAHAHDAVLSEIRADDSGSNMGSTVVALTLADECYEIAWVGDSRAYLFNGELKQLTHDHTPVSDLLAAGAISVEQAAKHPERHVLTQSLGVSDSIELAPGFVSGRLLPGEQILLCSDGLTDELSDQSIADKLSAHRVPGNQVDALVNAALGSGGNDNITVVLVGAPDQKLPERRPVTPDMEATQNIGDALRNNSDVRSSHKIKVWLLLSAMVVATVIWLQQ